MACILTLIGTLYSVVWKVGSRGGEIGAHSDTGRQALVTLELPMLPAIGLLSPGQMVAVGENAPSNTWRGLVRSTQISAQWSESLTVRQTIELERHYP